MTLFRTLAAILPVALIQGCGGGDGGGSPAPSPAPAPPAGVTLAAANYQAALRVPMLSADAAYTHASMGVSVVDNLLNRPLNLFPVPCPQGGSTSMELTDRNGDGTLDPNDTVHLRWNACKINDSTSTGLVRVQLTDAVQLPGGGREYQITIQVENLELTSDRPGAPPITVNCGIPLVYTRTSTSDHLVIQGAGLRSGHVTSDTGTAEVFLDYLQDHATQTYSYVIRGNATSTALGGRVDFTTPLPFTGVIGEYPSAGRLSVTGIGNSSALLSEEGTAANDNAAVFAAVDTNGDGTLDASNAALTWASVMPPRLFAAFGTQVTIGVLMP